MQNCRPALSEVLGHELVQRPRTLASAGHEQDGALTGQPEMLARLFLLGWI